MKSFLFSISVLGAMLLSNAVQAQVTIGIGAKPNAGALLELKSQEPDAKNVTSTTGLAMPRVKLTNLSPTTPAALAASIGGLASESYGLEQHIGLTVYNVKDDLCAPSPVAKGIYVWDGTKWQSLRPIAACNPTSFPLGNGIFTGRTLFDLALTDNNGTAADKTRGKQAQRKTEYHYADFTTSPSYTYTFTPTGVVSNVRFFYIDATAKLIQSISPTADYSGNNISTACTATVIYKSTLNTDAKGTIIHGTGLLAPLTADIYVIYNTSVDGTGTDVQQKLTAVVQDCSFCGAYTSAGVWKNFMCHNLNAASNYMQDPLVPSQAISGDYYQWGQASSAATAFDSSLASLSWPTGAKTWPTPATTATAWNSGTEAIPGKVIANDPCPVGYRVPTKTEWDNVILAANGNTILNIPLTWTTAGPTNFGNGKKFGDYLFLPIAGFRGTTGVLSNNGNMGYYQTSMVSSADAYYLSLRSDTQQFMSSTRANGLSVRCISEF